MTTYVHECCYRCDAEWHRWKYDGRLQCPICGYGALAEYDDFMPFDVFACFEEGQPCPYCEMTGHQLDPLGDPTAQAEEPEAEWIAFNDEDEDELMD